MLTEIAKAWLVPPAANALLFFIALLIIRWHRKTACLLIATSFVSLMLLSTDYVASVLEGSIQKHTAVNLEAIQEPQPLTIVVAGGSHHKAAREYGYATPTAASLTRLHYASYLHRKTGYPVLLTGGPTNSNQIHSEVLAKSFTNEFKTEPRWLETQSRSTQENAQFSAEILFPLGRKTILLVTHAYHMQRAVYSFEEAGFTVIPAPTVLSGKVTYKNWRHWIPGASGLHRSSNIIYEYLGLARDSMVSTVLNSK